MNFEQPLISKINMKKITLITAACILFAIPSCTRKATVQASPANFIVEEATYNADETAPPPAPVSTYSGTPDYFSPVISVPVPYSMVFAGELVDLSRYDKRERFDREINGFTYLHSTTMLLIKRANRYFPVIEPILKRNGIPDDFKYLCVIESNLDPRAVSSAKAAGLWQFMEATGKEYGLEVTGEVDERYSVEKATRAACMYLRKAYDRCGSWAGAALSYNGGQARITGQLTQQGAEDALDLWLVEETSRYYYRMLAIKQIMENPRSYGFYITPDQLYKPFEYREVTVTETIDDLAVFAKKHDITYAQLKDINPWLRSSKLTVKPGSGKEYTLKIPTPDFLYYKKNGNIKVHDSRWVVVPE